MVMKRLFRGSFQSSLFLLHMTNLAFSSKTHLSRLVVLSNFHGHNKQYWAHPKSGNADNHILPRNHFCNFPRMGPGQHHFLSQVERHSLAAFLIWDRERGNQILIQLQHINTCLSELQTCILFPPALQGEFTHTQMYA